jgi:hypothetical protein
MENGPRYPWRLDTNDRYRELVTTLLGLSTAALLLPVFLGREFLGISPETALKDVLPCTTYWSWGLLGLSILSGIVFHFFSAKWARLAWQQPVGLLGAPISETFVERALEVSLWCCILSFLAGVLFTLLFLVSYSNP